MDIYYWQDHCMGSVGRTVLIISLGMSSLDPYHNSTYACYVLFCLLYFQDFIKFFEFPIKCPLTCQYSIIVSCLYFYICFDVCLPPEMSSVVQCILWISLVPCIDMSILVPCIPWHVQSGPMYPLTKVSKLSHLSPIVSGASAAPYNLSPH